MRPPPKPKKRYLAGSYLNPRVMPNVREKISSADLDPAITRDPLKDFLCSASQIAFDPNMRLASEAGDDWIHDFKLAAAQQAFGEDMDIFYVEGANENATPRRNAPWWLFLSDLRIHLAYRAGWKKGNLREFLESKPTAMLDYALLLGFYRNRMTDAQIAEAFQKQFKVEHAMRNTITERAVKDRRRRLVKWGNEKFGKNEKPGDYIKTRRERWKPIREGKPVFGASKVIDSTALKPAAD